jgi:hypothetical protein
MILQLQFLPLLFAEPNDCILVSDLPENPDPRLRLISDPPAGKIESWGPSLAVAGWAKKHSLAYSMPEWSLVRTLNSKIFSFSEAPKLPGAQILFTENDVHTWVDRVPGPKVLKTSFGTAGTGHFHIGQPGLAAFLKKQFSRDLPVIGEPWVERILDFSTQWRIRSSIEHLGSTIFENGPRGTYLATLAGVEIPEWALTEHLAVAAPLVQKMAQLGYFGNLGIDAFVYRHQGKEKLQPVVEINGRKTMSWAALQIKDRHYPEQAIRFSYSKQPNGLLPKSLVSQGRKISFPFQVAVAPLGDTSFLCTNFP